MRIDYATIATEDGRTMAYLENGDPPFLVEEGDKGKAEDGERVLVRYDPEDQFCRVITAAEVARLVAALESGTGLVRSKFEDEGRDAYNNDIFCEMEDARKFVAGTPMQPGH